MHLAFSRATPVVVSVDELFQQAIASQAHALPGSGSHGIELGARAVGRAFKERDADYCYLSGVLPVDPRESREQQARSCFEQLEAGLAQAQMSCDHIVRTWLYLDCLLDWYDEFNTVRSQFFRERGMLGRVIPASTGIGLPNAQSAALVAGALAVKPKTDAMRIHAVPSPLQCPAIDYLSAFSRAMEVSRPQLRKLYISGTASIAPDGRSAHRDDPAAQIELTMKVIEALLDSRQMKWSDTTRMICYFKDIADIWHFDEWCQGHGLGNLPAVFVQATICRDELLFEVELDAAAP
jgi:enamine deaminase RidA (YjgF/YER057c/UK114 family)